MPETELTRGERDVLAERAKQRKRWGDKHDDREHGNGDLARAGSYLAAPGPGRGEPDWADDLWRRLGDGREREAKRRARMVVAAALLLAEVDRLDREIERRAVPVEPPKDEEIPELLEARAAAERARILADLEASRRLAEERRAADLAEALPVVQAMVEAARTGADGVGISRELREDLDAAERSAHLDEVRAVARGDHAAAAEAHDRRWAALAPIEVVYPDDRREERASMTFDEARKAVGGYVEAHRLSSGWFALLNEEGRLRGLPVNRRGTSEVRNRNGGEPVGLLPLVGPVVLVPPERVRDVLGGTE